MKCQNEAIDQANARYGKGFHIVQVHVCYVINQLQQGSKLRAALSGGAVRQETDSTRFVTQNGANFERFGPISSTTNCCNLSYQINGNSPPQLFYFFVSMLTRENEVFHVNIEDQYHRVHVNLITVNKAIDEYRYNLW